MATDATGTPTTLFSIPKFNVNSDAPSGLGGNAQMDAIDALLATLGIASLTANDVPVWDSVAGKFKKASGTPSSTTFLRGDGAWATISIPTPLTYRKTTAKQVVNTTTETDLLNGEITIAANALGTTGMLRLTAFGDWKQFSGASVNSLVWKLKLGATTIIATTSGSAVITSNAGRFGWKVVAEIMNLGAANSQWTNYSGVVTTFDAQGNIQPPFTTGEGATQTSSASGSAQHSALITDEGGNATAVDTTASQALALTVTLPAANANLDVTLKGALVEII